MSKSYNLIGKIFWFLEVIRKVPKEDCNKERTVWECKCICNKVEWISQSDLILSNRYSCSVCHKLYKDKIDRKKRFKELDLFPERRLTNNVKLVKEWDCEKNYPLNPKDFHLRSGKKVWWKCHKNQEHSFESSISNRKVRGCPFCANKKIIKSNSLLTANPELSKEWDYEKNYPLLPEEVPPSGSKEVWWKCLRNPNHSWLRSINARQSGFGCPYCSGKKVDETNSFFYKYPNLENEWHPENKTSSKEYTFSSGKSVFWLCKKGHKYKARIADKAQGRGCPICRNQTSVLELRILSELEYIFNMKKNDVLHRTKIDKYESDILIISLKISIEIDGNHWHSNRIKEDVLKNEYFKNKGFSVIRIRGVALPLINDWDISISKKQENNPDFEVIKKILLYIRNNVFNDVFIDNYISKGVFCNEERFNTLKNEISNPKEGCSILDKAPHLDKEWDYEKNNPLTPSVVSYGSNSLYYWICNTNPKHKWQASANARVKGNGCLFCAGKKPFEDHNLLYNYPEASKYWDYNKNTKSPTEVLPKSNKMYYWVCPNNPLHKWSLRVNMMVKRVNKCLFCLKNNRKK